MAGMQGGERLANIAEKWHALAQRRLAYIRGLERSDRWKRYYTDEQYILCLRGAERAVMLWSKLAVITKDVRPAAWR